MILCQAERNYFIMAKLGFGFRRVMEIVVKCYIVVGMGFEDRFLQYLTHILYKSYTIL